MLRIYRLSIFIITLMLLIITGYKTYAINSTSLEERILQLETEVIKLDAQKENYDFIKNEIKEFRSFIETERHNLQTYIELLLWLAGFLITLFMGMLYFLSIRTYKDLIPILENSIKEKIDKSLDKNLEDVNEKIDALQLLINREILYKSSGILIVGDINDFKSMEEEISVLENYINKQCVKTIEISEFSKRINLLNPSIVIFCNKNGYKEREQFINIIETLNNLKQSIPLIIYTYGQEQLRDERTVIANSYFWTTYANNPDTLVGSIFTLAHSFTQRRSC